MFTWLNKQGVRSSDGFEVQFTGRFSAEYREGTKVIALDVEDSFWGGRDSISIRDHAFERWDHSTVHNSPQEQLRLRANFKQALEFQGLGLHP